MRVYDWQGPAHDATFQFSELDDIRRQDRGGLQMVKEACAGGRNVTFEYGMAGLSVSAREAL